MLIIPYVLYPPEKLGGYKTLAVRQTNRTGDCVQWVTWLARTVRANHVNGPYKASPALAMGNVKVLVSHVNLDLRQQSVHPVKLFPRKKNICATKVAVSRCR